MVVRSLFLLCLLALTGCEQALSVLESASENSPAPPASIGGKDAPLIDLPAPQPVSAMNVTGQISVCSFNVQFLGNSSSRDDRALAEVIAPYDIVVVQELVSPPFAGQFPDGTPFKPDEQSAEFFVAMQDLGFRWVLSEEDTGTGDSIHRNGSSTEWWVAFYKPGRVQVANDLPHGFLASDHSNNDLFERVPYAFGFRTPDQKLDFVLISVHLMPGGGRKETARRAVELHAISEWIRSHEQTEHDFIILGDMNIEDAEELALATPPGFISLNNECRPTNTNVNGPKPYDHVMFSTTHTTEIDRQYDMHVVNLLDEFRDNWTSTEPYPGQPYNHNEFRKFYSDHHPVDFRLTIPASADDAPFRIASGE
jgi:endonuclease/exonuclease/phosphatase family metal-dependent hydrolase